jgi:predicted thioesterase
MKELMCPGIVGTPSRRRCRTRPDGAYRESGKSSRLETGARRDDFPRDALKMRAMDTHDNLPMSRIAQLMENAAARLLRPQLAAGENSLAIATNFTHVVTGPISGNLRAVATLQGASGREHHFLVHVFDESGLVASAEHRRAIVGAGRAAGLVRRRGATPPQPLHV